MPATDDSLQMLRSAFPKTQFRIENGGIVGGGVTVSAAEITKPPLALVQMVAPRLRAVEDAALKKAQEDAARG